MSKISLSGNASGTGVFTFASPNSNTDRTLDLPDASGTIDRLNRAGNVLQVVSATYGTAVTSSTNTYVDTGLTATITPTSATSKILVIVNQAGMYKTEANQANGVDVRLLRNSTVIHLIAINYGYTNTAIVNIVGSANGNYLDSPATTSAVTYKTQFKNNINAGLVGVNDSSVSSAITLMEIAA